MAVATQRKTRRPGFKQTEVGPIPEDWAVGKLGNCLSAAPDYGINAPAVAYTDKLPVYIRITDITEDGRFSPEKRVSVQGADTERYFLREGELVFARTGASVGKSYLYNPGDGRLVFAGFLIRVKPNAAKLIPAFLAAYVTTGRFWSWVTVMSMRSGQPGINGNEYAQLPLPLPSVNEQRAISAALSDADALVAALDQLIAKKRDIKQAAMQQLLTGNRRLPGFSGAWGTKTLLEITDCLDNLRVPLNESERLQRPGDVPYCGANGILDYIDSFVVDDDIILIAEDGGHFDEYYTRPIAYRMIGKCWVNNHAHILKAKQGVDQEFVFYSLVHKNILRFLASGTRAKLNKFEMYKIEINMPQDQKEQTAIATVLSDMDAEIAALQDRRGKCQGLKQGMMQKLLTGSVRLV
jgi:type I restriction enzyme, S subunit